MQWTRQRYDRPDVTEHVLDATRAGRSLASTAARDAGLEVVALDGCSSSGDLVNDDGLSLADTERLLVQGRAAGRSAPGSVVALGEVGVGNTTVAAALAAMLLEVDAVAVVGLGSSADSKIVERKRDAVSRTLARSRGQRR